MSSEPEQNEERSLENLCFDCLEKIFTYLPIPDLLNVADSSQQLRMVAEIFFSLQHGNKSIDISGFASSRDNFRCFVSLSYIVTANLKIMFQLIRCFGHLVSQLEIEICNLLIDNIASLDINIEHLKFYANKYCSESFTEFTFRLLDGIYLRARPLNHCMKPFANVYSVCVQSSEFANVSLIELFPKMRRLTYHCYEMEELLSIRNDLQSLDHLEIITNINFDCWNRWDPLLKQSILKLKSLTLPYNTVQPSGFSFDSFLNLQELKLTYTRDMSDQQLIHLKTVKNFTIVFSFRKSLFPLIPFSFDNLEKLNLTFDYTQDFYDNTSSPERFYDFILKHPTILKLRMENVPGSLNLHRLANMLPLLEEAELICRLPINDVIQFMNEMKALNVFAILIAYYTPYTDTVIADMMNRLKCKWHGVKYDHDREYKFTHISK